MSEKHKAVSAEGFERIFAFVGGHGLFQWRLLLITSMQLLVLTWHQIGYVFLGSVPDHWCQVPELKASNWTEIEQKLISIPQEYKNLDKMRFKKCEYFDLDYARLVESSSFEEANASIDWKHVGIRRCNQWNYDRSIYHSTVATQFNLVCDNRWMAATIQGSYMIGAVAGTLFFGTLSDRYLGRRRTVLTALSLVVTAGILASYSTSYWMFLALRFIIAFGVNGSVQNSYVIVTEHADRGCRAVLGIIENIPFGIGYMLLPIMAYYLKDWDVLQLSFGLISTILVVYYWILPESPRWLATHGYTDRAVDALRKVADINGFPPSRREDLEEILKQCVNEEEEQDQHVTESPSKIITLFGMIGSKIAAVGRNLKMLVETEEVRRRSLLLWTMFFIGCSCYYGMIFSGGNLTNDPYLLVFLGGLMEMPAYTLAVPFVSKLGRRPSTVGSFLLTGLCMLCLSLTPNDLEVLRMTFALLGKLFVTAGFAIVILLSAELYPTELRTTGLAVAFISGRIGAVASPYIVDLTQTIHEELPTIIFGMLTIIGGLMSLLLPETKTLEMSDRVDEIEMQAIEEMKLKHERRKQNTATCSQ